MSPSPFKRRNRVTVIYKSGVTMKIKCKAFTVRKNGAKIVEVEWDDPKPRPLHFGVDDVDDVAAIWTRR